MAHFDGDEQHLVQREEDRNLDGYRQATGQRIDLLLLIKRHQFLLLLGLVVGIARAQRGHLRLHRLHLRHRGIGFVGEREEGRLDQHRNDQDRDAEIADQVVDVVKQGEQRLGDEVEPAPVDQQIEVIEVELLFVTIDHPHFLSAGEQPGVRRSGRPRRDGAGVEQVVGLIGRQRPDGAGPKIRDHVGVGFWQQHGRPVFVGNAQPRVGDIEGVDLLFCDGLVSDFLRSLVAELADQAFVQDVIAQRLRGAVARDQREGKERDGFVALVHHLVLDREQILVVDRDGTAELKALAVIVGQRHRMADTQRAGARLRPHRVRLGNLYVGAGGIGPAELGIERIGAAGRRQQHDRRRLRIDRLAKLDQRQIVDASALEVDRALQAVGCDRDAR